MAVPFYMPEEQNLSANEFELLRQLAHILRVFSGKLERMAAVSGSQLRSPRAARLPARSRRNSNETQQNQTAPANPLPDLFNLLVENSENQLTAIPDIIAPRRRTASESSESSCCDESKNSIIVINEPLDEPQSGEIKRCTSFRENLPRLSPQLVSGSLWTAMICLVGWHLFRSR